ncbi:DUF1592 domain-containing protein [Stieleria varia]|uniref:DUF1592 domain-containing protein n=1 Tax=Stieleria varia TaxID=2528005 RepID=A0A5C6BC46_9BACT|nr:DUF1592 domain-containing protein [Stieleria varia]TWU08104.1 hypothetical protein Pla52n_06850 [Stieleria varia]
MKIIVIADDFTGAAEVAGAAIRFGLTAEVHVGQVYSTPADIVVVDADSRSLDVQSATARVCELTRQALELRPDVLFKKVDSLLRGPVAAEVAAMRKAAGLNHCLLVCGNPRKHRMVVQGKILVNNVPLHKTEFAADPEHPCHSHDVMELLSQPDAIEIGDVTCSADLMHHARRWYGQRSQSLAAGGAEFFEAVLEQCLESADPSAFALMNITYDDTPLRCDGDILLVSGTSMTRCDDWPVVQMDASRSSNELVAHVCHTLSAHGRAAIRAVDIKSDLPEARIEKLADVASGVLAHCRPAQVWVEGGRTASMLIRELGYQQLAAISNAGDGIVALRSIDEASPLYLIKPGSYSWIAREHSSVPVSNAKESATAVPSGNLIDSIAKTKGLLLFVLVSFWFPDIAISFDIGSLNDILTEQCIDCHNADTQEGTVDLSRFSSLDDVGRDRPLWKTVFDVVEAGQMPLADSGYELDETQREALLSFARKVLSQPNPRLNAIDPGKPILRRLTRLEYNNTVRDLFGLNYDIFMFPERLPRNGGLASLVQDGHAMVVQSSMREYGQKYDVLLPDLGLPGDSRAEYGYANRGDAMNFSPLLFEKYSEMASAIASSERLLRDSRVLQELFGIEEETLMPLAEKSDSETVAMRAEFAAQERIGNQAAENDTWHDSFVRELTASFERGSGGTFDVPEALNNQTIAGKGGLIKVRVNDQVLLINPNIDLWLASFATVDETSGSHSLTNRNKGEKVFELTFAGQESFDPRIQHFGVCVLSRRNQSGRVQLSAVLSNGQRLTRQADVSEQTGNVFFSWVAPPGTSIEKLAVDGSKFTGDYVLLDDFGFIFGERLPQRGGDFQSPNQQEMLNSPQSDPSQPRLKVAATESFLTRAYRREVTESELAIANALVADHIAKGHSEIEALRRLIQTVLTSPEFLFQAEPLVESSERVREVTAYELANRLSYFLWASMPDEDLMATAESGELRKRDVLHAQIRRMLADRSRSRELSESFAVQWLRLDQLYSSKPDREIFKTFYSGPQGKSTLHGPMMTEALLLFETVLVEDRTILDLYDPDFTWLNGQLAKLYGLQDEFRKAKDEASKCGDLPDQIPDKVAGSYWLRTQLPDRTRGGVMTMAGPLTLTSLPFRTSPIKRGAWLLETVFNRPPSEPKVAFVLEEAVSEDSDAQQTQTVRQLFDKHRSDPNCNSCHSRIDPPGFSLEVFDAMGVYRTHDGEQAVDASGTWNDRDFDSPAEFKDAIRAREQELVRGFVEHMLSYALGRHLEYFDMTTVDQIVTDAAGEGYRMSAIIEGIVLSYPFQHVRNLP